MGIYSGSKKVNEVYYGNRKIKEVYHGSQKVFPDEILVDDFTNSTTSNNIWNVSGVRPTFATYGTAVEAGNGKGDMWTKNDVMTSWNSRVEHKIYHVTDDQQQNSLLIGSSGNNLYAEYGRNGWSMGYYDGSRWVGMTSGGGFGLTNGSVVAIERTSLTTARFLHNGTVLGSGTLPSNVAYGLKVGFTLRANNVFISWFRSPAIDDIRVVPL